MVIGNDAEVFGMVHLVPVVFLLKKKKKLHQLEIFYARVVGDMQR